MPVRSIARKLAAVVAVPFLTSAVANAAPILPGQGLIAPAEPNGILGVPVFPGVPVAFTAPPPNGFSGTLTASVIQESIVDNPLGGLTFTYLLRNDATSATAMERIVLSDFSGFATDVSYFPTGGTVPSVVDRSFGAGAIVGWDFTGTPVGLGTLMPNQTSALLVVQTNAPSYDLTQPASIIDGKTISVPSIGPSINLIVPEPAALSVLAIGGVALRRRARSAI